MPEIHIDVVAELHRRSVEKTAKEIQARFDKVGFEVHPDMNKREVEAVAQYLERRFGDIHTEVKVDVDHRSIDLMTRSMGRATRAVGDLTRTTAKSAGGLASLADDIKNIGTQSMLMTRGLGAVAAPLGIIVAIDFAKWAVTATGALGMIPAAAAAATAGIGTLAIATAGFGDTIKDMGDPKKFAEGLALLSPNAQQAALEIKALVDGPLGELKRATQDAFFTNWPEQLHNLTGALGPALQQMTTSIATSFNQMFTGITDQMMTPAGVAQLETIFANISQTFQNLVPGAKAFSQAMLDITEVGSGFLPGIADSVSSLAQDFANFIREAKESGKLGEWIQNGIDAVSMLATQLWEITGLVMQLFGAGGDGQASIESFKDDLESVRDILKLMNGDFSEVGNELTLQFNHWGQNLKEAMTDAVNHVSKVINTWLDGMSKIPILGGAVPDFRLPEIKPGETVGGGGNFGAPPGGQGPRRGGVGPVPQTDWRNIAPPSRGGFPLHGVPGVPPEGGGPSEKEQLDAAISALNPSQFRVDPFAGMPAIAGLQGQVDPQKVLEERNDVENKAWDLEQARARRIAMEQTGLGTEQDIVEARRKELELQQELQQEQYDLAKALKGTTEDIKSGFEELGVALDPDFGISKGLAGLAENLVKFLGSLAAAPMMGKLAAQKKANEAATGIEGGYGLAGIASAQDIGRGGSGLGSFSGFLQGAYERAAGLPPGAGGTGTGNMPGLSLPNMNLGSLNTPQAIAAGGQKAAAVFALAQSLTGTPYSMPLRNDCSGMVHRLAAAALGLPDPPAGQRFATPNEAAWLSEHGALPGMGGPNDLSIGIDPRPGSAGHTAATLPGGLGAETGQGPGGSFGTGGPGANQSRFTQFFHIPLGINSAAATTGGNTNAPSNLTGPQNPGLYDPSTGTYTPLPGYDKGGWVGGGGSFASPFRPVGPHPHPLPPVSGGRSTRGNISPGMRIDTSMTSTSGEPYWSKYAKDILPSVSRPGLPTMHPSRDLLSFLTPEEMLFQDMVNVQSGGGGWPAKPDIYMGDKPLPKPPMHPAMPGFAKGGAIPIMAHAGEYVVNASATSRFGPLLERINHYQAGGPVPPKQYGGVAPPSIQGGGGVGITQGGPIDTAIQVGAAAADIFAPGSGQAIQMGMKLANRAIQFGGEAAGIGVQGLMETFLPTGGSELANNNWLTRIGGAFASAAPALPNLAGQLGQQQAQAAATDPQLAGFANAPPPLTPQQMAANAPLGGFPNAGTTVTNNLTVNDQTHDPDRLAKFTADHLGEMNKSGSVLAGANLGR